MTFSTWLGKYIVAKIAVHAGHNSMAKSAADYQADLDAAATKLDEMVPMPISNIPLHEGEALEGWQLYEKFLLICEKNCAFLQEWKYLQHGERLAWNEIASTLTLK